MFIYQLKNGQVFLPPKKFVKSWADSGKQIIPIHNNMNERVQKCAHNSCKEKK